MFTFPAAVTNTSPLLGEIIFNIENDLQPRSYVLQLNTWNNI